MQNFRRKPPRATPSLLPLPNRDRIVSIFMKAVGWPVGLLAIELEHRQTLTYGEVSVLSAFVEELGEKVPEHIMPKEFHQQQLEGAAQILGETVAAALRKKGYSDGRGRTSRIVQFG